MEEAVKSRLNALLERRAQNEELTTRKALAEAEASRERYAKKAAAQAGWHQSLDEIRNAISNLNKRISEADLELFLEDQGKREDSPGIAQITVGLRDRGSETGKRLVFNVNAFGLVQLVSLIPHSGLKIADFNIGDVQHEHYEVVLVEFLDQCFQKARLDATR